MMPISIPSRPNPPTDARPARRLALGMALAAMLSACARTPVAPSEPPPTPPVAETPAPSAAKPDQDIRAIVALMTAGHYQEAIEPIRRRIETQPDQAELYANLGVAYARIHQLGEAEAAFQDALKRHFEHAELYNQLGIVYREMGRFKDAEQAYTNALRIDPRHANAELNLGILLELYFQDPERALPHFQAYEALRNNDAEVSKWIKDIERRRQDGEL